MKEPNVLELTWEILSIASIVILSTECATVENRAEERGGRDTTILSLRGGDEEIEFNNGWGLIPNVGGLAAMDPLGRGDGDNGFGWRLWQFMRQGPCPLRVQRDSPSCHDLAFALD